MNRFNTFKEYVDMKPTKEMVDHFITRTNNHINLVKKYANRIDNLNDIRFNGLVERVVNHDSSKFREPEYSPYVWTTWMYKVTGEGGTFEIPESIKSKSDQATIHHILNNAHHPEFHDPKFDADLMFNTGDRDKPSDVIVDATAMDDLSIAEMCADWCSVGYERGNNPKDWADMNIGKRWKFTEAQSVIIYSLIDIIFY